MSRPTVVNEPVLVDNYGNISVNGRSGVNLLIGFNDGTTDDPTVANVNVAAKALFFEVAGTLHVALAAGDSIYTRRLHLFDADVEKLPIVDIGYGAYFVVRDETPLPTLPASTLWEGTILARNFSTEPPAGDQASGPTVIAAARTGSATVVITMPVAPVVVIVNPGLAVPAEQVFQTLAYLQLTNYTAPNLTTAQQIAAPAGTIEIIATVEGGAVRWRDDGIAPTATVGMPMADGDDPYVFTDFADLQFIATSAAPTVLNLTFKG